MTIIIDANKYGLNIIKKCIGIDNLNIFLSVIVIKISDGKNNANIFISINKKQYII